MYFPFRLQLNLADITQNAAGDTYQNVKVGLTLKPVICKLIKIVQYIIGIRVWSSDTHKVN